MKRPPVRKYHHGDLRRAAVDRAGELVATQGIDAVALRSLARDLGVTHAALAHHFGERRAILQAMACQGFIALADAMDAAAASSGNEAERLRAVGEAYVSVARRLPGPFRVMFGRELLAECAAPPEALKAASDRAFGSFMRAFGAQRLDARTLLAWSAVHGLASLATQGPLPEHAGSAPKLDAFLEETVALLGTLLASNVPSSAP